MASKKNKNVAKERAPSLGAGDSQKPVRSAEKKSGKFLRNLLSCAGRRRPSTPDSDRDLRAEMAPHPSTPSPGPSGKDKFYDVSLEGSICRDVRRVAENISPVRYGLPPTPGSQQSNNSPKVEIVAEMSSYSPTSGSNDAEDVFHDEKSIDDQSPAKDPFEAFYYNKGPGEFLLSWDQETTEEENEDLFKAFYTDIRSQGTEEEENETECEIEEQIESNEVLERAEIRCGAGRLSIGSDSKFREGYSGGSEAQEIGGDIISVDEDESFTEHIQQPFDYPGSNSCGEKNPHLLLTEEGYMKDEILTEDGTEMIRSQKTVQASFRTFGTQTSASGSTSDRQEHIQQQFDSARSHSCREENTDLLLMEEGYIKEETLTEDRTEVIRSQKLFQASSTTFGTFGDAATLDIAPPERISAMEEQTHLASELGDQSESEDHGATDGEDEIESHLGEKVPTIGAFGSAAASGFGFSNVQEEQYDDEEEEWAEDEEKNGSKPEYQDEDTQETECETTEELQVHVQHNGDEEHLSVIKFGFSSNGVQRETVCTEWNKTEQNEDENREEEVGDTSSFKENSDDTLTRSEMEDEEGEDEERSIYSSPKGCSGHSTFGGFGGGPKFDTDEESGQIEELDNFEEEWAEEGESESQCGDTRELQLETTEEILVQNLEHNSEETHLTVRGFGFSFVKEEQSIPDEDEEVEEEQEGWEISVEQQCVEEEEIFELSEEEVKEEGNFPKSATSASFGGASFHTASTEDGLSDEGGDTETNSVGDTTGFDFESVESEKGSTEGEEEGGGDSNTQENTPEETEEQTEVNGEEEGRLSLQTEQETPGLGDNELNRPVSPTRSENESESWKSQMFAYSSFVKGARRQRQQPTEQENKKEVEDLKETGKGRVYHLARHFSRISKEKDGFLSQIKK